MHISKKKLYGILLAGCGAGYIWLFYNIFQAQKGNTEIADVCIFKYVTHLPCPSCGSTNAIMAILSGNLLRALDFNPLGFIVLMVMVVVPVWIVIDLWRGKKSLLDFYILVENTVKKPLVGIPLFLLICLNWIWNIYKYL